MMLDLEDSYKKILISEMLFIKRQKMALNKQSDTDLLSDAYSTLINTLSNV